MLNPEAQFSAIDAVVARAAEDPGYRADLIKRPAELLKEAGYTPHDQQEIIVVDVRDFERPPPLIIYLPPPEADLISSGEMHELLVAASLPEGCGEAK